MKLISIVRESARLRFRVEDGGTTDELSIFLEPAPRLGHGVMRLVPDEKVLALRLAGDSRGTELMRISHRCLHDEKLDLPIDLG